MGRPGRKYLLPLAVPYPCRAHFFMRSARKGKEGSYGFVSIVVAHA